jgi:uncharacterized membrane protein
MMSETTQAGLSENGAGAIAYITIVPAIVFLVLEPYNRSPFVRFHCWQCIFFSIGCIALWVVNMILAFIPVIGWLIMLAIGVGVLVLWIVCIMKAFGGQKFMIPVIGPLAAKQAGA